MGVWGQICLIFSIRRTHVYDLNICKQIPVIFIHYAVCVCKVLLCGGVRWRRTDTHIAVVIQSAREGGREEGSQAGGRKGKKNREETRGGRGRLRCGTEMRSDPFSGPLSN